MAYSVEKAKQRLEAMKARKSQWKDYWGTKPGANRIRILPNWLGEPDGDFFRETGYHRKLGTERDKSAVCLIKEGATECPACDLVKELYKTKNKEDAELAKSIRNQTRILFNIVDLNDLEKGVQVWITGTDVLEQILGFCANPMYGDLTDPETGRNITVVFAEGKNTKSGYNEYNIQPDPIITVIQDLSWLEQMIDLDSIVKPITAEEMENLLSGDEGAPKQDPKTKTSYQVKSPVDVKTCFENAKYSSDDLECANCTVKIQCLDKKAQKQAKMAAPAEVKPSAPVTAPPAAMAETPKEAAKPSSSEIQQRLNKIRQERAAERAAKGN